jgi:endonuclease/exonuclease/phosphatase family metal-dependent hydrolase
MVASIETRARSLLTPVPAALREKIRVSAAGGVAHGRWYSELACLHEVQIAASERSQPAASPARVVAWNIERGRNTLALASLLRVAEPQLVLLSEVDVGMARSQNRHTALDLAAALGFGCTFGVEFVELGLGGPEERIAHAGQTNTHGLHGGAILSGSPLEKPAVVRLEHGGAWLAKEREEPRIGGRIAVVGTWRLDGEAVTVAAVHLESHSDPGDRASQLAALLDALESYAPGAPALIGGDLNTFSVGYDDLVDRASLKRALQADPRRLRDPVPYEPLFEVAAARGYEWEHSNRMSEPTHRVPNPPPSARGGLKLDWFLVRGLRAAKPEVLEGVHPEDGRALSDHEPVLFECRL